MRHYILSTTILLLPLLSACGEEAVATPPSPMTQAQFVEVKKTCNLKGAKLISSARTEKSTVNGVPMTVTYTNDEPDAVTIKLAKVPSDQALAGMIMCLNKEFQRLNATAIIGGYGL